MARMQIRGNTQILAGTIDNAQIGASAAIATTKLADGVDFIKRDGSVALTANFDAGSFQLKNVADGVDAQDAVTKAQLDAVVTGLDVKESVRVASTANIDVATGGLLTIDGVTLVDGDRVLVKDNTDPIQNGIYAAAAGAWVRTEDADGTPANEVSGGMFTFVEQGTVNAGAGFSLVADGNVAVDTDQQNFTQFSGAGQISAGSGLTKSGNTISFKDGNGLAVNGGTGDIEVQAADSTLTVDGTGVKLSDLTSAYMLVGDATNRPVGVAMSGDISMDNAGATTITTGAIVDSMVNASAAIATSKLADGAEFLQRDGSVTWTGAQAAGGFKLTGLGAATTNGEAVEYQQWQTAETAMNDEITNIETASGLSATGTYSTTETTNYLKAADFTTASLSQSLKSADIMLDAAIKAVADDLADLGTGSLTDITNELNALETSFGNGVINELTGAWTGFSGTNYIDASADMAGAVSTLDGQAKTNADAINTLNTVTVVGINDELTAIEAGVGALDGNGDYVAPVGTNYLDSTTSVQNEIETLDTQLFSGLAAKLDDTQLIDDDTFASATATNIASAESVKAYVDAQIATEAVGFVDSETPTGAIDGANTAYTLAGTPSPVTSVKIYQNGIRLEEGAGADYTVSGSTVTMNFAPDTGDSLEVDYRI